MRKGQVITVTGGKMMQIVDIIDAEGKEVKPNDSMPPGIYTIRIKDIPRKEKKK